MKQDKQWFQSNELIGLAEMPSTTAGIIYKSKKEGWVKRKAEGVKGRAFEYHIDSLPANVRAHLGGGQESQSVQPEKRDALLNLISQSDDEFISRLYQQVLHKGIDSLYVSPQDRGILDLLSDLNEQERKEIFAFVRKAKYMLLAGLEVDPAMKVDVDEDRKAG